MSTPFQNRLVGTVIVAAIAIIFLPDILDGDKTTYQEEFDKIPDAPKLTFAGEPSPFPTDKLDNIPSTTIVSDEVALDDIKDETQPVVVDVKKQQQPKQEVKVAEKKVKEQLTKARPKEAWVVQLGSFRHKKNVDELAGKLQRAGFKVFTKPLKTKSGMLTKVFVGPELRKSTLEKKLPELAKLTGVNGKVAKYLPTK